MGGHGAHHCTVILSRVKNHVILPAHPVFQIRTGEQGKKKKRDLVSAWVSGHEKFLVLPRHGMTSCTMGTQVNVTIARIIRILSFFIMVPLTLVAYRRI